MLVKTIFPDFKIKRIYIHKQQTFRILNEQIQIRGQLKRIRDEVDVTGV